MSDKGEVGYDEYSGTTDPSTLQRNWWWKYRQIIREAAAEFLGVMIMIIFGNGVVCQISLSADTKISPSAKGDYLSLNFAWACGAALGVWCSFGITGGHINPAVTLAFATWRGFPWKKVPYYIFAQLMGALVGSLLVYGNYYHAIDIYEGGAGVRTLASAGFFSTYALDYMPNVACFFSEFLGTAVLLLVVMATVDKQNAAPPGNLFPLVIFLVILAIGSALGMETGYAINPARDLGPRLMTSMVGYGRQVYTFRNQYWLWCPVIAPIMGAQFGAAFYDIFLYNGDDSIANKWGKPRVVTNGTGRNV